VAVQSCLTAKDAAFNVKEFIENSSKMAFLAVKDCEKELDRAEREIDEKITEAITHASEAQARDLLACLKFITDLERIGDLAWSLTLRIHKLSPPLRPDDAPDFVRLANTLEKMLEQIHKGFTTRNVDVASWVLRTDSQIDQACRAVFYRHLSRTDPDTREYSTNLLFIAQAFERAGDHAKNLAEEIFHLVEGHTFRHEAKRRKPSS
jgi:phosphate transport system protein